MDELDKRIIEAYDKVVNPKEEIQNLNEKGYVVMNRQKEYLTTFDYDMDFDELSGEFSKKRLNKSASALGWSTDKKKAKVFSDKVSAQIALDHTLGRQYGKVISENKLIFAGYHLKDNILDDITVEEMQDMLVSNIPSDKIDERMAMKEFETLLRVKMNDARSIARKVIPALVKDIQANREE